MESVVKKSSWTLNSHVHYSLNELLVCRPWIDTPFATASAGAKMQPTMVAGFQAALIFSPISLTRQGCRVL
jgi:hypothetical protein